MKVLKYIKILPLLASLAFTSCFNSVFYDISQDVESEDATVSGVIAQITRYTVNGTEYLVCNADGGLRYKLASNRTHDSWKTYSNLPFDLHSYDYYNSKHNGQQIIQVLADEKYLYLLTCEYFNDDDEGTVAPKYIRLWGAEISSWDNSDDWTEIEKSTSETKDQIFKVYKYSSSGYYYSAFCIFSTNSINPSYRKVYIRSGKYGAYYTGKSKISSSELTSPVFYEVSNGVISSTTEISADSLEDATHWSSSKKNTNASSAAWYNGGVHFFISPAVATNEHYDLENLPEPYTNLSSTNYVEPTFVYYGYGSSLYYRKAEDSWASEARISANRNISSLAVCSDSILIGQGNTDSQSSSTSGGITRSKLEEGVPTGITSFTTNAESQISAGYIVFSLLNANPAEAETASALYATIGFCGTGSSTAVSYSSVGMWSYYPERGNWNRE